ncbi:MarR family transcriptional regulator [Candidatus Acetothermia bacterium]|nr:MarR family transcriptional regulator [Candidatus Acetothermia bacterium]MBI3460214.1 MarR family transcriptional regulator [Candidatus Acetothermia bacterium]
MLSANGRLPETLSPRVGFLLHRCNAHIREMSKQALKALGITPRHYGIMATLYSEGALPQQTIGEMIEIDRTSMVLLVDDLEKKRLMVRGTHPNDRRYHLIYLTPSGKKLFEKMDKLVENVEEEFLVTLTSSEKEVLRRVLMKLIKKNPSQAHPSANSRTRKDTDGKVAGKFNKRVVLH